MGILVRRRFSVAATRTCEAAKVTPGRTRHTEKRRRPGNARSDLGTVVVESKAAGEETRSHSPEKEYS